MTNAAKLAAIGGGGTNCSRAAGLLNREQAKVDLVIFVSDNESWVDAQRGRGDGDDAASGTASRRATRRRKLVCIDMQPYGTTQALEREDILNVGGFSDAVFEVVADFARVASAPITGSPRSKDRAVDETPVPMRRGEEMQSSPGGMLLGLHYRFPR